VLGGAGYSTATILGPDVGPAHGVMRGFDHVGRVVPPPGGTAGVEDVAAQTLQWLDGTRRRPVFLVVQYGEPTVPYTPSGAAQQRLVDGRGRGLLDPNLASFRMALAGQLPLDAETRRGIMDAYDAEVTTLDDAVRALFQGLEKRGVLRNALVVFTSSHGTELGDHGGFGHGGSLHEELIPGVVHEPVQLADVFSSILDWAGVPQPQGIAGRPLPTSPGNGEGSRALVAEYTDFMSCFEIPLLRQAYAGRRQQCGPADRVDGSARAVIRPPDELILFDRYPAALFDLGDPTEEHDRAAGEPDKVAALRAALDEAGTPPARSPSRRIQLDAATKERLRALGYVVEPQ
jgi:arylsulfatase A-like enzyme